MSVPPAIDAALKRLASALGQFEAAAERQARARAAREDGEEEFAIMRDDRSRLAVELEGALARLKRLEQANAAALQRIERASETILACLGDGGDDDESAPAPETDADHDGAD